MDNKKHEEKMIVMVDEIYAFYQKHYPDPKKSIIEAAVQIKTNRPDDAISYLCWLIRYVEKVTG